MLKKSIANLFTEEDKVVVDNLFERALKFENKNDTLRKVFELDKKEDPINDIYEDEEEEKNELATQDLNVNQLIDLVHKMVFKQNESHGEEMSVETHSKDGSISRMD